MTTSPKRVRKDVKFGIFHKSPFNSKTEKIIVDFRDPASIV